MTVIAFLIHEDQQELEIDFLAVALYKLVKPYVVIIGNAVFLRCNLGKPCSATPTRFSECHQHIGTCGNTGFKDT